MKIIIRYILVVTFIFISFLFFSCLKRSDTQTYLIENIEDETETIDPLWIIASDIAASLDDSALVSQLFITGVDGKNELSQSMVTLLREYPAGGVMLFSYNLDTDMESIRNLISQINTTIKQSCHIFPFIAIDHEGGTVNRLRQHASSLRSADFYWQLYDNEGTEIALDRLMDDCRKDAVVLNHLGINMNFAPVAEHLNDENFEFLARRSYGPDISFCAIASHRFMSVMQHTMILCVVKHFPGSAGSDPHYFSSVITANKNVLDLAISPFVYLINNGARALMVSHSAVPAIDSRIASLSPVIMQNWLREELGFKGLIISDDFSMAAAGNLRPEQAAVLSIAAGADMILVWQQDLARTHKEFMAALEVGRLTRERLEESAARLIYEKLWSGVF